MRVDQPVWNWTWAQSSLYLLNHALKHYIILGQNYSASKSLIPYKCADFIVLSLSLFSTRFLPLYRCLFGQLIYKAYMSVYKWSVATFDTFANIWNKVWWRCCLTWWLECVHVYSSIYRCDLMIYVYVLIIDRWSLITKCVLYTLFRV